MTGKAGRSCAGAAAITREERRRSLERLRQQEAEGVGEGGAEGCETQAVTDQVPRDLPFRCLHPDDFAEDREGLLRCVECDLESGAWRQCLGEAKQEPPPTNVARPALDGQPCLILGSAGDGDIQRPPNPGMAHRPFGEE